MIDTQSAVPSGDGTALPTRERRRRQAEPLTERELQVLTLLADGWRLAEIGTALHLTVKSFHAVRKQLFAKLGARSDSHAAAIAFRRGILQADRRLTYS